MNLRYKEWDIFYGVIPESEWKLNSILIAIGTKADQIDFIYLKIKRSRRYHPPTIKISPVSCEINYSSPPIKPAIDDIKLRVAG